ncbi:DoxX family protein [Chelatococcus sp. SYSU_G07232]|uniref:DoxX family protein n=1 Tax=Chelatococcus albus TaxID=3047466 RepID=A0ABT7AM29_9HYPH|nr:DoxX family protein [Chelatococcus sp. SYSU_G07232]MDJ1159849.1 DoxX family protein [Chelatococcus sp. SYSU_G07232]
MQTVNDLALVIGRMLLAAIFVQSGFGKIAGYAGAAAYMESAGVPGILLPLVILVEFGGGLAIVLGWQTRWAALALAGFSILSALLFHLQPGDRMQMINFMKNLSIAGGFLALMVAGAGRFSLDARGGR